MTYVIGRLAALVERLRSRGEVLRYFDPGDGEVDHDHLAGRIATWIPLLMVVMALLYFLYRLYGYLVGGNA